MLRPALGDTLMMGDDWQDKFDDLADIFQFIYLERTPELSTTEYKHVIRNVIDSFDHWLEISLLSQLTWQWNG